MNIQELKQQIDQQDEPKRSLLRGVYQCVGIGGAARPEFSQALTQASSLDDFISAVIDDDALRFEKAWGLAARASKTHWIERFSPLFVQRNIPYQGKGVYAKLGNANTEAGVTAMVIPVFGTGRRVNLYLFSDGSFNEDAAEYFTSVEGHFTVEGVSFNGVFDVLRAPNAIIFEQWELNERGQRVKAANLAEKFCRTS